jgi:putative transcriptional regulator
MSKARDDLTKTAGGSASKTVEMRLRPEDPNRPTCSGQFLLATPGMMDERFDRSVIYMCAHSEDGAMGIIINHPATNLTFSSVLQQLDLMKAETSPTTQKRVEDLSVFRGGPVDPGRGFVLHSGDVVLDEASLKVGDELYLTTTLEILRLIAIGRGPQDVLFALGYAGWAPGQLDQELQGDGWLTADMDRSLLFDRQHETKYQRVLGQMGIDLAQFSSMSGHA